MDWQSRAVTCAQMRELDRATIEGIGLPAIVLMENAGRGVAQEALLLLGESRGPVAILCAKGNNGGDGLVVARHLWNAGCSVELWLLFRDDEVHGQGEAAVNYRIARRLGLPMHRLPDTGVEACLEGIRSARLVIDALYGTGLEGELRPPVRGLVEGLNRLKTPVVSVDLPSGLHGDEGRALGAAVRATVTATLGLPKKGFFVNDGPGHVGRLVVVDIGIPRHLTEHEGGLAWKPEAGC